jgi:predicted DNA-binding protein (MmcQ/YjbR family)
MDIIQFRDFCLSLDETITEDFPFDQSTLAFRIEKKIFALTDVDKFEEGVNLKCSPERAIELRESYNGVFPAFHMNKTHWNTVVPNSDVPLELFKELVELSFTLVKPKPKRIKKTKS